MTSATIFSSSLFVFSFLLFVRVYNYQLQIIQRDSCVALSMAMGSSVGCFLRRTRGYASSYANPESYRQCTHETCIYVYGPVHQLPSNALTNLDWYLHNICKIDTCRVCRRRTQLQTVVSCSVEAYSRFRGEQYVSTSLSMSLQ
jgi:hypothetical protein